MLNKTIATHINYNANKDTFVQCTCVDHKHDHHGTISGRLLKQESKRRHDGKTIIFNSKK